MIRLIATDLDGTLLNNQSELTERTVRAVSSVMQTGAKFVLASGRMYEATRPYAEILQPNAPIVVFNGAMACEWQTAKPLFSRTISPETARAVCRMAENRNIFIQCFPERGFFYEKRQPEVCDEYEGRIRIRGQETAQPLSSWIELPTMKLLALGENAALLELQQEILQAFPALSIMLSHPTYMEIVAGGVEKGSALKAVAERFGIAREEIAAFGDAGNDVAMLEYAEYGYVMENADPTLRLNANHIAPANSLDGVAKVLETLLANNKIGG